MNENEVLALVGKLSEKTEGKKITWKPTAEEHTFITTIKGNTFHIMRSKDEWQQPHTALMMVTEDGRTIWRLDDEGRPMHLQTELHSLYDLAQRIGDRVDEKLSEALKSLDLL